MGNWITLGFWFSYSNPPLLVIWQYIFAGFLLVLLALAVVSLIMRRRQSIRFWGRLENFSWGNFAIGIVLLFFHYEQVPFFTARIILLLWVALMVFWMFKVLKKTKISPEVRQRREAEKLFKKYLPK